MNLGSRQQYDEGRGFNFWWQFVLFAIIGQLCWNVENQWFNTFLYAKITKDVSYVTAMVIISATLTCFSTFLFGTLSDRKGVRNKLIGWGNVLWGVSTIAVGLCQFLVKDGVDMSAVFAACMVVALDGVMSFIGSIAYDCGFNVWVNDHTTPKNSGRVGWVLGVMPVIATILGTVLGGIIIGKDNNYQALFISMGSVVILCGILGLIFTKDRTDLKPSKDGSFWHQFSTPFRFKKLAKMPNMKEMILACCVIAIYFTSFNFYFVHLGNWAIYTLGFTPDMFGYVEGVSMVFGILIAIPISKLIDKNKIPLVCFIGLVASFVGLMLISAFVKDATSVDATSLFSSKNILLLVSVFFFGTGEILLTEACMIWIRGLFPQEVKGQFEGLRCIFFVWIPMFLGTICGDIIIKGAYGNNVQFDEFNHPIYVPQSSLFLYAGIVVLLSFIPLFFANKLYKKRINALTENAK